MCVLLYLIPACLRNVTNLVTFSHLPPLLYSAFLSIVDLVGTRFFIFVNHTNECIALYYSQNIPLDVGFQVNYFTRSNPLLTAYI